jgi:inositol-phosphate phosphatase/L-galactose 1-phosphate phosphatase/histidinol-phosphatase
VLCPSEYIDLANRMADVAGAVVLSYFRKKVDVEDKKDDSPVTIADRQSEAIMRELIGQNAPDHGILGEEYGPENIGAEWVWVLDPIDGTKAFITGKPSFGILIALLHFGTPVLGIIDQPVTGERWMGASGRPSTLNGERVLCRPCDDLSKAYLYATTPDMFHGPDIASWERLKKAVKLPRYGADCYAAGLLASGFVDLMVEASLQPYDYLALVPVIEGAGGVITDWEGGKLGLESDGRIIAAGDARAHQDALRLLA